MRFDVAILMEQSIDACKDMSPIRCTDQWTHLKNDQTSLLDVNVIIRTAKNAHLLALIDFLVELIKGPFHIPIEATDALPLVITNLTANSQGLELQKLFMEVVTESLPIPPLLPSP